MTSAAYVFQTDIFSNRANVHYIFKTCESLSKLGVQTCLVVPMGSKWKKGFEEELFEWHGVKSKFRLIGIPVFKTAAPLQLSKFNTIMFKILATTVVMSLNPQIVFTRGLGFSEFFCSLQSYGVNKNAKLVYDCHELIHVQEGILQHGESPAVKERELKVFGHAALILALTSHIENKLVSIGVPEEKILFAPDGVDLDLFKGLRKDGCRKKIGVPESARLVVYAGHLYKYKGVFTLARAMSRMMNAKCLIVGGLPDDIKSLGKFIKLKKMSNINLLGHVPPTEVPTFLVAADVLVLPNSSKVKVSKYFTSPLKMFEYMASGNPIVASDLPSIRDVLNEGNSFLVKPDSATELASGINLVFSNPRIAKKKAQRALQDIKKFTWGKRAKKIMKRLNMNYPNLNGQLV